MNLDFDKNRWSILYGTYARFYKNYYGYDYLEPNQTVTNFWQNGPFMMIDCSRQNESIKSATVDVRIEFDCKENVLMNTTRTASLYIIAWFSTIRWPTLYAKLPKCDTLFPKDDIKIYDASKSTAVFSRTQSCLYQYLWICKISLLDFVTKEFAVLREGCSWDMFSLIIFLDSSIYGFFF